MRSLVLPLVAGAIGAAACVVYEPPLYRPPPPNPALAPAPRPPPPLAGILSEHEAVNAAFELARARELQVDHVKRAMLDDAGRWHVDLRGHGDHAQVLLDGRDGRLLRGKFHKKERRPPDRDGEDWDD